MTMIPFPLDLEHLVQVVGHDHCGYRAECICGWASRWVTNQATAEDASVDHREVAVGPPSGLDVAINDLLDLQDDLADTVMWLAESWASDLPVPRANSHTDYTRNRDGVPGLDLLVYCDDRAVLARVSDLLDASLVADTEPNRLGHRYERAVRSFGRVRICAYRSLPTSSEASL
jgi:hypothetical protein